MYSLNKMYTFVSIFNVFNLSEKLTMQQIPSFLCVIVISLTFVVIYKNNKGKSQEEHSMMPWQPLAPQTHQILGFKVCCV